MTCRDFVRCLSAGTSEELPPAARAHLADCATCAALARADTATDAFLRRARQDRPAVDASLAWETLESRLPDRSPRPAWLPARRSLALTVGLAAAGFAGAAVVGVLHPGHPRPVRTAGAPAESRRPADSLVPAPPAPRRSPVPRRNADARPVQPRPEPRARLAATHGVDPTPRPTRDSSSPALRVDDLAYLNRAPEAAARQWRAPSPDEWEQIAAHIRQVVRTGDDFVTIPLPRLASTSPRAVADAVASYQREAAVVDPRLSREVTCASKATALSDLCARLAGGTGVRLTAGRSVADEKVTVFCERMPLRDLMRQLSRPFGYTWLRSGPEGEYRYELVQDLRSQLLEEALRNQDQDAALLDLDREMSRYQKYRDLSPDEAQARARSAPPGEKEILEHLASKGWGPAQLYSRLSPDDLAALRAGQSVTFSASPGPGQQSLPAEMGAHVLTSLRDYRIVPRGDGYDVGTSRSLPDGVPPASVPGARPIVSFKILRGELGQLTLQGLSGFAAGTPANGVQLMGDGERNLAVGISPAVRSPQNAVANAKLARDPALRRRVTLRPRHTCGGSHDPAAAPRGETAPAAGPAPRITSADFLEALHRATGMPVISDYYTRFSPADSASVADAPLFDALNQACDALRVRWSKDGTWLQFRSAGYFQDRLKEVPARHLERWAAARREHGALSLDDLAEIAQLPDSQLDSSTMAEGARSCFGLAEWDLGRNDFLRSNLRFLAGLSADQRRQAQTPAGLPFGRMSLAQQQQFLSLALDREAERLAAREDLAGASLRVDYTLPGEFQWSPPATSSTPPWERLSPAPVRERTREAALQAARRISPQAAEAQVTPTERTLTFVYSLGGPNARLTPFVIRADRGNTMAAPPRPRVP